MRSAAFALGIAAALASLSVRAQQVDTPDPIVQVSLEPQRVVVGQAAKLRIAVLAPNYMTSPPELPTFQLRNAVTRQSQSMNISEERDGMTYAGVRFEFAIYPQEPGSYAIPAQNIRVKFAAEPPVTREVEIALPGVSFEAFIPNAAAGLEPFLVASELSFDQSITRSSDPLKVGDAVSRAVTIKAQGTPAMLLPPQRLNEIEGLRRYPGQPVLDDRTDRHTGILTSTRIDSATYMLERPGRYQLPAVEVDWWNIDSGRVEHTRLDAVVLDVAAGSGPDTAPSSTSWNSLLDRMAEHWIMALGALIVLAAFAWTAPAVARRFVTGFRYRRAAYLDSEAWSFQQLRAAARTKNAKAIYFGILGWLQRFEPLGEGRTIDAMVSEARDGELKRQVEALQSELFAPVAGGAGWSPSELVRHIGRARRTLRIRSTQSDEMSALPRQLNPTGWVSPKLSNRRVAR